MGILQEPLDWIKGLREIKALPKRFSVLELGDQFVTAVTPKYLAREFYKSVGCGRYVSIDGNAMNGSLLFDLNIPTSKQLGVRSSGDLDALTSQYDLVTDFGTGEHIFDQAAVWRTIHEFAKPGGHVVFDRPCVGYEQHCYYLIKEELVRDLAAANGYHVVGLSFRDTTRGRLIRGVLRLPEGPKAKFVVPQQGRYKSILKVK